MKESLVHAPGKRLVKQPVSKRKSSNGGAQHGDPKSKRAHARRQSSNNSSGSDDGDAMTWEPMSSDWRRCETMWLAWSGGHGPFNINATSYPDGVPYGSTGNGAMQWQIAYLVGYHSYQWVASVPGNTTFYFDLEDTSTGETASTLLPIHINNYVAQGLASCQVDLEDATSLTATPSKTVGPSLTASATLVLSAGTPSSTSSAEADGGSSSNSSHGQDDSKGLLAGVIILSLALLGMLLMQYRLKKRLARLQKGQSTVGRWMNHHHRDDNDDHNNNNSSTGGLLGWTGAGILGRRKQEPYLEQGDDGFPETSENSGEKKEEMRPSSGASNAYATSESSGRLSAFFTDRHQPYRQHYRSASRETALAEGQSRDLSLTRRLSLSSVAGGDPFADTEDDARELDLVDEDEEEDILNRSASQQKRYSQGAESAISDSNTATTSGTEMTADSSASRLSSATHSDQLSSVGNVSVVSDDHYHRSKAYTINRGGAVPPNPAGRQFLDPHLALLDSRR